MGDIKKDASTATEGEKKLAQELIEKIETGKITINQARIAWGLKPLDDPVLDKKLVSTEGEEILHERSDVS